MSDHLQNELKKEFQLERMILFSDAVFAIAITLLAIEIKIPELEKSAVSDHLLLEKTGELIPKFIGFLVSFLVIGLYWTVHHRMYGFVINYTQRLLWLNLFFLLAVVLMPFSSGFYSEYVLRQVKLPVIIYVCNISFLGIMNFITWRYLTNAKHGLTLGITPDIKRYYSFRSLVPPLAFLLTAAVYLFISPKLAIWVPALIFPIMRLVKKRALKHQPVKK